MFWTIRKNIYIYIHIFVVRCLVFCVTDLIGFLKTGEKKRDGSAFRYCHLPCRFGIVLLVLLSFSFGQVAAKQYEFAHIPWVWEPFVFRSFAQVDLCFGVHAQQVPSCVLAILRPLAKRERRLVVCSDFGLRPR